MNAHLFKAYLAIIQCRWESAAKHAAEAYRLAETIEDIGEVRQVLEDIREKRR